MVRPYQILAMFLVSGSLQGAQAASASETGPWILHENTDRFTDEKQINALSFVGREGLMGDEQVYFIVACAKGTIRFGVGANRFIGLQGTPFVLTYRVDQREPRSLHLSTTGDGKIGVSASSKIANQFVRDIAGGKSLYARISTKHGSRVQSEVSLEQADVTIERVYEGCKN